MSEGWQAALKNLTDYISQHPNIEISGSSVAIPGDVRAGFYRLFDEVTREFVSGNLPSELKLGSVLSGKWAELSRSVIRDLKLDSIDMLLSTKWFLDDPLDGLTRSLFDPLFDVLKGEDDAEHFETVAIELLRRDFDRHYREGYRRWAIVALIKALAPDRLLLAPAQDSYTESNLDHSGGGAVGLPNGEVPEPVDTKTLSFISAPMNAFLAPKIIIRSTLLDAFVSLRPDFHETLWESRSYSGVHEWLDINDLIQTHGKHWLWPDMVVYTADRPRDLALVADFTRIARPDMNVEFRERADWFEKEGTGLILRHHRVLKPRLGSFVVCCEPVPAAAREGFGAALASAETGPESPAGAEGTPGIRLLSVGYDTSELQPIVAELVSKQQQMKNG